MVDTSSTVQTNPMPTVFCVRKKSSRHTIFHVLELIQQGTFFDSNIRRIHIINMSYF